MTARIVISGLCLFTALLVSTPTWSQERREQLNLLDQNLNSPDNTTRVASFEAAIAGNDRVAREFALRTALASADAMLRSLAFGIVVKGLKTINVQLTLPPSSAKALEEASGDADKIKSTLHKVTVWNFQLWGGSLPFYLTGFDAAASTLKSNIMRAVPTEKDAQPLFPAQVSGTTLELSGMDMGKNSDGWPHTKTTCVVSLELREGGVLVGVANCRGEGHSPMMPFPAKAQIFR